MNEDTKLPKHSVSSGFSMENTVMREGGSSGRSGVSNSREDVLELAPVETRASRGSKLLKESPRFSDTSISRSTGNSLHTEMENENEDVGLKSSKGSNGEIEGEIRVEKEELPTVFLTDGTIADKQLYNLDKLLDSINLDNYYFFAENRDQFKKAIPLGYDAAVCYVNTAMGDTDGVFKESQVNDKAALSDDYTDTLSGKKKEYSTVG